jgi:hypothetical protein
MRESIVELGYAQERIRDGAPGKVSNAGTIPSTRELQIKGP